MKRIKDTNNYIMNGEIICNLLKRYLYFSGRIQLTTVLSYGILHNSLTTLHRNNNDVVRGKK